MTGNNKESPHVKASILVVDDEPTVLKMLSGFFREHGYEVSSAESAERALEILRFEPADLVLTDLKMPGMHGLDLAQRLLEQDPDRPVLLMTAHAELSNARQAVSIGVYEYFVKPFDMTNMLAGIRRGLNHRRLVLETKAYQRSLEKQVEARTEALERKIEELKARDVLLRHLLSIHPPRETLQLAVTLAVDLTGCNTGVLYIPDPDGHMCPKALVGFDGLFEEETVGEALETLESLARVQRDGTPLLIHEPGAVRREADIHSFGMVPVQKHDEIIAILEVGRKRKDVMVSKADLDALAEFEAYIAMAVTECQLQEGLPEWRKNVSEVLKAAEKWTD